MSSKLKIRIATALVSFAATSLLKVTAVKSRAVKARTEKLRVLHNKLSRDIGTATRAESAKLIAAHLHYKNERASIEFKARQERFALRDKQAAVADELKSL